MIIDFQKTNQTFPVSLGDASSYIVGRVVFQIKGTGTFSFTPKIKVRGSNGVLVNADLSAVTYTIRTSNTSVSAGTAITSAGVYEVDGSGVEVWLDGSYASGTCVLVTDVIQG